jgi:hypothetical protein
MSFLIEQLTNDQIRGGRLVLAYSVGGFIGIVLAIGALLAI